MGLVAIGQHGGFRSVARDEREERPREPVASAARPKLDDAQAARFRAMVDGHFDFIWRALRGLGVPTGNAEDATQHVFLVASQKLALITVGSERSFLFSTARGIAANARRARARSREVLAEDALAEPIDAAPDPEQVAVQREGREVLGRLLDGLTEDLRTVFVLFELEGMTALQIAELLSLPAGTVASRLRRAREEFQASAKRFQIKRGGAS